MINFSSLLSFLIGKIKIGFESELLFIESMLSVLPCFFLGFISGLLENNMLSLFGMDLYIAWILFSSLSCSYI